MAPNDMGIIALASALVLSLLVIPMIASCLEIGRPTTRKFSFTLGLTLLILPYSVKGPFPAGSFAQICMTVLLIIAVAVTIVSGFKALMQLRHEYTEAHKPKPFTTYRARPHLSSK